MRLKKAGKYTKYTFVGLNVLVIIAMLLSGYGGYINPTEHPFFAVFGLAFPGFVVADILFFAVWPFFNRRLLAIPAVGLLLSIDLLMDYSPLSIPSEHPAGSIKVLSYNTLAFNYADETKGQPNPILQYIIDSKADIVCIQEWTGAKGNHDDQWEKIDKLYPHCENLSSLGLDGTPAAGGDQIAVLSKYPILDKQNLPIKSKGNVAGVFKLNINGKPVTIINLHLETVGFSMEEKAEFKNMVKGKKDQDAIESESRNLISKLAKSAKIRAAQADVVADYIKKHPKESIILCGDFNDHPLSYTHRTINQDLIDCYRKTGNLPGFSQNTNAMYVRIDNIMCSYDWQPYECQVDKSVKLSDHYPIFCYFKQK